MHNVFVSYHHDNDGWYKEELLRLNLLHGIFEDGSVDTGDIDADLPDETIRTTIRDEYLKNTTVTVVLVGLETKTRKHIDWEIYSSMFDGQLNKQSGIIVINLPSTRCGIATAPHHSTAEKQLVHPNVYNWTHTGTKNDMELCYPYFSSRLIDNVLSDSTKISVVSWETIANDPEKLKFLVDIAHTHRGENEYDLSERMRRSNS